MVSDSEAAQAPGLGEDQSDSSVSTLSATWPPPAIVIARFTDRFIRNQICFKSKKNYFGTKIILRDNYKKIDYWIWGSYIILQKLISPRKIDIQEVHYL